MVASHTPNIPNEAATEQLPSVAETPSSSLATPFPTQEQGRGQGNFTSRDSPRNRGDRNRRHDLGRSEWAYAAFQSPHLLKLTAEAASQVTVALGTTPLERAPSASDWTMAPQRQNRCTRLTSRRRRLRARSDGRSGRWR